MVMNLITFMCYRNNAIKQATLKMKEIPVDSQVEQFEAHLAIPDNDRIFFSGKFGSGKTYFLKQFFKSKPEEFNVIHIYPVNYSIASNEDIMELIKADIIIQLVEEYGDTLKFETTNTPIKTALLSSLKKHPEQLLFLLDTIPGVGGQIKQILTGLLSIKTAVQKDQKQQSINTYEMVMNHLQTQGQTKGGLLEENAITKVLSDCVKQLSLGKEESSNDENAKKKQSVLILDDLDRIDPDHIFRILNVFAAHFDNPFDPSAKNKFGFDKVILVGDAENIRSIFHHRFGSNTDYSGYLNKFYSKNIFGYSLNRVLEERVSEFLSHVKIANRFDSISLTSTNSITYPFLTWILVVLIENNAISIRDLVQFLDRKLHFAFSTRRVQSYEINNFDIALALYCFCGLIGLEEAISKLKNLEDISISSKDDVPWFIPNLLLISNISKLDKFEGNGAYTVFTTDSIGIKISVNRTMDRVFMAKFSDETQDHSFNMKEELIQAIQSWKKLI